MCYCSISDFWSLCALQVNRVVFRSFLELKGRRSGKLVATSRRSSVATSGQQKKKSRSDPTLRCSVIYALELKKERGDLILGLSKNVWTYCGKRSSSNPRDRKDFVFVFLFSNLFMIYRTMPVFNSDMF